MAATWRLIFFNFLVCRLDKLLSWFSTQTSVVNFRYYLFCLCNVRRQYLLPGILGIYCFLTGVPSLPAIALPKGCICSLVNQVYTSFRWCHCLLLAWTDPMLVKCCAIIYDTLPTLNQHCVRVLSCRCSLQKWDLQPMLFYSWAMVIDDGPAVS